MVRLALKVDVDTLRGTREGVPRLLALFARMNVRATFLFSLGPDHTGRAVRRVFRPGFFAKVQRTSVLSHYGLRTLLYGTLLPGPDIGRRCASLMRATEAAGHEAGIHTWDHVAWQDGVAVAGREGTIHPMRLAHARFVEIFGHAPQTHGAAGWQMNPYALRELDRWGLPYASDGRIADPKQGAYRVMLDGVIQNCIQLPTTLPTLDELIGVDGMDAAGAARRLLSLTTRPQAHVFTLHAELEGSKLIGTLEDLLLGWCAQGYVLGALQESYFDVDPAHLPVHEFAAGSVSGRSGTLMVPGAPVATSA